MQVITDNRCWSILENDELAGFMMLDFQGEVEEVIICPTWQKYAVVQRRRTLQVLQVVTSYVLLYAAAKQQGLTLGNFGMSSSPNVPDLRPQEATILPDIVGKTVEELTDGLTRWGKNIVTGETETLVAIAKQVCSSLDMGGVTFALPAQQPFNVLHTVTFIASRGQYFCGWKDIREGDTPPAEHPELRQAHKAVMINGSTDSPLSGEAVRRIYAPQGTYSFTTGVSTWQYVNHPFCGAGDHIDLEVSFKELASLGGMRELQGVLSALLGLRNMYVSVLGGFSY